MTDQEPHESPEARLKRLTMRANRRGIKEMDVILGGFAQTHLADMTDEDLNVFDALLWENDQDLYAWVTGQSPVPEAFTAIMARVTGYAHRRLT